MLRTQGIQGFYAGSFAQTFVAAADAAGGGLRTSDLATATPQYVNPEFSANVGNYAVASLPASTETVETLPASAAFMALDKNGGSVICATSMSNLFGTGLIAPGTGILLAASPHSNPRPTSPPAWPTCPAASPSAPPPPAQARPLLHRPPKWALPTPSAKPKPPSPSPGRANTISCPGIVPGGEATGTATADLQGQGLAIWWALKLRKGPGLSPLAFSSNRAPPMKPWHWRAGSAVSGDGCHHGGECTGGGRGGSGAGGVADGGWAAGDGLT